MPTQYTYSVVSRPEIHLSSEVSLAFGRLVDRDYVFSILPLRASEQTKSAFSRDLVVDLDLLEPTVWVGRTTMKIQATQSRYC